VFVCVPFGVFVCLRVYTYQDADDKEIEAER
jgi:hypothetical protein